MHSFPYICWKQCCTGSWASCVAREEGETGSSEDGWIFMANALVTQDPWVWVTLIHCGFLSNAGFEDHNPCHLLMDTDTSLLKEVVIQLAGFMKYFPLLRIQVFPQQLLIHPFVPNATRSWPCYKQQCGHQWQLSDTVVFLHNARQFTHYSLAVR